MSDWFSTSDSLKKEWGSKNEFLKDFHAFGCLILLSEVNIFRVANFKYKLFKIIMLKVSYLLRSTSIPEIHEKENFEKKKFKDMIWQSCKNV